jgi:small subunit ribosomal protein S16
MAVRIRLKKTGTRNSPCYRIIVVDQRATRDGRAIEEIGFYDPIHYNENVDLDRVEYWMSQGAQPSETVSGIVGRAKKGKSKSPEQRAAVLEKRRASTMSKKAKAKAAEAAKETAEADAE